MVLDQFMNFHHLFSPIKEFLELFKNKLAVPFIYVINSSTAIKVGLKKKPIDP